MVDQPVEWTVEIKGMTCDHCATSIDTALRQVAGVTEAVTSYASGTSHVVADARVDRDALDKAVASKGYRVTGASSRSVATERRSDDAGSSRTDADLAIIGSGSAAFAAAIRAAELGARVIMIESGTLGGTCVNVGCVPSKTLLRAAEAFHRASHQPFAGIHARVDAPDFGAIMRQKDELVTELRHAKYEDVLAAYPSVTLIRGRARLRADGAIDVDGRTLRAGKILLATGASPWAPPIPGLADARFLTSTEALSLTALPATLAVIGGSAVGLEIAQLYARLGTRVTVLEALPRLVPAEDAAIGDALAPYLAEEGITVHTGVAIEQVRGKPGAYRIDATIAGGSRTVEAEQLLVATGRRPNTKDLGLEEAGVGVTNKGAVAVDDHLETSRPGVYAAGDVAGEPAFVYVAAYAGSVAAENALRGNTRVYDTTVVPRVTFTDPGVASVGLTEAQARERGLAVAMSTLPMSYVPRAIAARDTRGFIKLVADRATNLLVGAHILAPEAGEMIQEAVLAIRFKIRFDELAATFHPYLTNAEGLKLACQTFDKDVAKLSCCAA